MTPRVSESTKVISHIAASPLQNSPSSSSSSSSCFRGKERSEIWPPSPEVGRAFNWHAVVVYQPNLFILLVVTVLNCIGKLELKMRKSPADLFRIFSVRELSKKVPQSLITETESSPPAKYIPWHTLNRILNLHAPEWSGEVRSITYSTDGKSVSVVYRIILYGTDAEIFREATGTAYVDEGDPVQEAETKAFGRACARFGLGLHLFHQDS